MQRFYRRYHQRLKIYKLVDPVIIIIIIIIFIFIIIIIIIIIIVIIIIMSRLPYQAVASTLIRVKGWPW